MQITIFFLHILTFIWRKHWHYILFNIAVSKSRKALQPSYKPSNTAVQVVDFAWSFSLKSLIQTSCFGFQHMRQTHNIYQIKKPVNHIMHLAIFNMYGSEIFSRILLLVIKGMSNEESTIVSFPMNLKYVSKMIRAFSFFNRMMTKLLGWLLYTGLI